MTLARHPTVADLRRLAVSRIPTFAKAFLESGTGDDLCVGRNANRFVAEYLLPSYLGIRSRPSTSTELFGRKRRVPFGVAPIGLASLVWPGAERKMARAAAGIGAPFCLSTMAAWSIEQAAAELGTECWFQLYPMRDRCIQADLLKRCELAGLDTVVVTVDVPVHNRREGLMRTGVGMPLRLGWRSAMKAVMAPSWTFNTLLAGEPRPVNLLAYLGAEHASRDSLFGFLSTQFGCPTTADDLVVIRDQWRGRLIIKGVLSPKDAAQAKALGADGIVLSNHGGRQLDAAPHPLDLLPAVRKTVGREYPILIDSGMRSGSDIAVALSRGADFALLGRSFLYGAAAHDLGADHVAEILQDNLLNVMAQLGCENLSDLRERHC